MMYPRIDAKDGPRIRAEYQKALEAVGDAVVALWAIPADKYKFQSANFIPRDDANDIAQAEHKSRLQRLCVVRAELEDIIADMNKEAFGQLG